MKGEVKGEEEEDKDNGYFATSCTTVSTSLCIYVGGR